MLFEEALKAMREGKKVNIANNIKDFPGSYLCLTKYGFMLYDPEIKTKLGAIKPEACKYEQLTDFTSITILSDDWEIIT